MVAFTSQSSVGTTHVTVSHLNKIGVTEGITFFGINLGMPSCTEICPTLLAVFAVHILGLNYAPGQYAFLACPA